MSQQHRCLIQGGIELLPCRPLSQRLMEAMALHRGYETCQEYTAFHRLPLLHDWFINGNSLQELLSLLV